MLSKSKEVIEVAEQEIQEASTVQGREKIPYEKDLFEKLKIIRRQLANEENVPAYIVLSDATLMELSSYLPITREELARISGFGEMKLEKYGQQFGDAVADYCQEHQLKSRIHLKAPKRQRPSSQPKYERETDTKQQSFDLFKQGYTPEKIAALRELTVSTIENHLAFYVQQGKIPVEKLVSPDKIPAIRQVVETIGGKAAGPIREALGDGYSYSEIRLVMAHVEFVRASPQPSPEEREPEERELFLGG